MGYKLDKSKINDLIETYGELGLVYGPKLYPGEGRFSDTDLIRYGEIGSIDDLVLDKKSDYSFKEILTPITETLFYFTEDEVREPGFLDKEILIFMRACDTHALDRLDQIYLRNGYEDYYYKRIRKNIKVALIGCKRSFENCFCVSMKANKARNYDLSIDRTSDGLYSLDIRNNNIRELLELEGVEEVNIEPSYIKKNHIEVAIPENMSIELASNDFWRQYDSRCIDCGRCNFVCPTCTCFTMQDIFYRDNGRLGERRRVWASCMVDGFTDVAGGESYRQKSGDRMRFKVLHKVYDFKKRNGYHMCVGCGNCDAICPEYISFSNCVNLLNSVIKGGDE